MDTNVTIDMRNGVAGDMLLSAMLDFHGGETYDLVEDISVASSVMKPTSVEARRVERHGREAFILDVSWEGENDKAVSGEDMKGYLRDALSESTISSAGRSVSERILDEILEAESVAHMVQDPESVHLHEAGTPDTLVDTVGLGMLFERLELDGAWIQGTPISLGYGKVNTEHGLLEVPVPAVRAMIRNLPVRSGPVPGELATPTGVASAKSMVEVWMDHRSGGDGAVIPGKLVGSGAGHRLYEAPFRNVLDIYLSEVP